MIQKLYEIPYRLKENKIILWSLIYKFNKLIINILYPIIQRFKFKSGLDEKSNIIVSVTSYPKRIKTVWITISSIMNQSVKPSKIILWLSEEEFENYNLPKNLTRLKKRGLEICFCKDNLKPHKKYYYAMQKYPNNIIVTIDDDIIYPENTIEMLYEGYKRFENSVVCNRAHKILIKNGNFCNYNDWEKSEYNVPSILNLATGVSGILYPPKAINDEVFNQRNIKCMAITTDDLWLKICEVMNNTPVVNVNKNQLSFYSILKTNATGLYIKNAKEDNVNDQNWKKLCDKYPEIKERLLKEKGDE